MGILRPKSAFVFELMPYLAAFFLGPTPRKMKNELILTTNPALINYKRYSLQDGVFQYSWLSPQAAAFFPLGSGVVYWICNFPYWNWSGSATASPRPFPLNT